MHSDSARPSNRAPHSYSHTCPHLKSAARVCAHKHTHSHTRAPTPTHAHTHAHKRTHTHFSQTYEPFMGRSHHTRPPDTFERSKGRTFRGFVTRHVYVEDGYRMKVSCVCAASSIFSHGFILPDELSVSCCLFSCLCL